MSKTRQFLNLILGGLISLILPACGAQKKTAAQNKKQVVEEQSQEGMDEIQKPIQEPMICLYGIPPEVYKKMEEEEKSSQEPAPKL